MWYGHVQGVAVSDRTYASTYVRDTIIYLHKYQVSIRLTKYAI